MTTAVTTTAKVYPINEDRAFVALARDLLNGAERDAGGRTIIQRKLSEPERALIVRRRGELEPALLPAPREEIEPFVEQMFAGLGMSDMTPAEAKMLKAGYTLALCDLPIFAIAQGCLRFIRGEVRPEELGLRNFALGFRPATDQLHVVCERIAQKYRNEAQAARALLNAAIAKSPPTQEQRDRGVAALKQVSKSLRLTADTMDAADAKRRSDAKAEMAELRNNPLLREYREAGIEPVYSGGMPVSLSMMLARGYTIQRVEHENVLVAPPNKPHQPSRPTEGT